MIYIKEQPSKKSVGKTSLFLSFSYNPQVVTLLKDQGDAIWHKKELLWEMPLSKLHDLINSLTYLDDIQLDLLPTTTAESLDLTIDYKTKPFDYQLDGIKWLINHKGGILGDPPGLGKTIMTTYAAEELEAQENIEHCLIICGINSLKLNWENEIHKHSDKDCIVIGKQINSKGTIKYASVADRAEQLYQPIKEFFVIINVEMLTNSLVLDAIRDSKNKFGIIVVDEVHKCKSVTSQRGKNLLKLAKIGTYHWGLTGTLLINNPLDSFLPLKFVSAEKSTLTNFKNYYCVFEQKFGHNNIVGYKNMDSLRSTLSEFMLRRPKDILKLPPLTIVPEYLEMTESQTKFYENIANGIVEEADRVNIKTTSMLGLITRLRQASTCPAVLSSTQTESCKIDRAVDLVEEIVGSGEKVLIFSQFKEPLRELEKRLVDYKPLLSSGDVSDSVSAKNRDLFQTDNEHFVLLATQAKTGTGFTLTRAPYAIFLDFPWTWSEYEQAYSRVLRISAEKPVVIYNLIAKNTIDERVQHLIDTKKGISDYLVDNDDNQTEDLKYLLGVHQETY